MENIKQCSPRRDLFISRRKGKISNKTHKQRIRWSSRPKERVRESVMQGEGFSTPHIHRTRWEPFGSCLCVEVVV